MIARNNPIIKSNTLGPLAGMLICLAATQITVADTPKNKADWMYKAQIGISTHYFGRLGNVDAQAERFDVETVAAQAAEAGAGWFLFTIHHQPWAMMAPNRTYDNLLGHDKLTAKRDLAADLAAALAAKGIRLMLYVNLRLDPRGACPPEVREAMGGWPPSDELIANVASVYKEFSLRYGKKVSGWWVDGAWLNEYKHSPHRERWFATIASALREGNPNTLVAFNPGVIENNGMQQYSKQDDYTAGEANTLQYLPNARWVKDAQCHVWTYLGPWWSHSGLRFGKEEITHYAQKVIQHGGVMTFEVGTWGITGGRKEAKTDPNSTQGKIDPRQIKQVKHIADTIKN